MGLLTGVGLLIRGVKAKNQLWIRLGVGFLVLGIGLMVATGTFDGGTKEAPKTSVASTIWGWIWFGTFAGGIATAIITNRKWLIWKAHANETKWYAQAGSAKPPATTSPFAGYDPNAAVSALRSPAASSPYSSPAQAGGGSSLDVNSASAQDLQSVLGVDASTADRIIAARHNQGPFTSFEQLISKGQVQPHILIPHRHRLVFGESNQSPAPTNQGPLNHSARRLDL